MAIIIGVAVLAIAGGAAWWATSNTSGQPSSEAIVEKGESAMVDKDADDDLAGQDQDVVEQTLPPVPDGVTPPVGDEVVVEDAESESPAPSYQGQALAGSSSPCWNLIRLTMIRR